RADTLDRMRGDVGGNHLAERAGKFGPALAVPVLVVLRTVGAARMTFHAVSNGGKIEAALYLIVELRLGEGLLGARNIDIRHRRLVDRRLHRVAHRFNRAHVGDHTIQVARREDFVEDERHLRSNRYAARPHALAEQPLEVGVAPGPDTGLT